MHQGQVRRRLTLYKVFLTTQLHLVPGFQTYGWEREVVTTLLELLWFPIAGS